MHATHLKNFWRDNEGATSIEYALIAVLLGLACISALYGVRASLNSTFTTVKSELALAAN
jgi:pilus assembly protein Flp/PilA